RQPGETNETAEVIRRRQAIVVLALVGLLVATYLWLYKIGVIGVLQCGTGSCEAVQTSRYAVVFGVPVALVGVAGYAVLFAVGLARVVAICSRWRLAPWGSYTATSGQARCTHFASRSTASTASPSRRVTCSASCRSSFGRSSSSSRSSTTS